MVTQRGARFNTETYRPRGADEGRGGRMRWRQDRTEGEGVRGVGSHYVEGGDVTDGDGWLHVRQV